MALIATHPEIAVVFLALAASVVPAGRLFSLMYRKTRGYIIWLRLGIWEGEGGATDGKWWEGE